MGDGTKESPYSREDVVRRLEGKLTAEGLDLSGKWFQAGIDLYLLDLKGIILQLAHLEKARLSNAHLERADLRFTHLEGAHLFDAHLEGADLSETHLEGSILSGAHLEEAILWDIHLEGANLYKTHLGGANLINTKFSPDVNLEDVDWGNYIVGEERDGNFDSAADTYRRLKQWYTNAGMYEIAAEFYYREMEAKRKNAREEKHFGNLVRLWIYRLLCGYGEKPERVIATAAAVIFGAALTYFAIGTLTPNSFLDSLYYSAVSFVALGYGSWVKDATGWVKGLGAFEAFMGVFMMRYSWSPLPEK